MRYRDLPESAKISNRDAKYHRKWHHLGNDLKQYRKRKKLTLNVLSESTGLSISYISDIENGRTNPSLKTCQRFCDFYGQSLAWLFINVRIEYDQNDGLSPVPEEQPAGHFSYPGCGKHYRQTRGVCKNCEECEDCCMCDDSCYISPAKMINRIIKAG